MAFESWQQGLGEPGRNRRLVLCTVLGAAVIFGVIFSAHVAGGSSKKVEEEKSVDVTFVQAKEEPPPPPPPPPPPATKTLQKVDPTPPPPAGDIVPTTIPTDMPTGDSAPHQGFGGGGGTGDAGAAPAVVAPTATAPPPPPAPTAVQLPEDADPPEPISKTMPAYPDSARSQGIEATIVVKFVVTETGDVTDVRVLKGNALFDAACIESVKTWKFKPAMSQGKPIRVYRVVKIPFQLRK